MKSQYSTLNRYTNDYQIVRRNGECAKESSLEGCIDLIAFLDVSSKLCMSDNGHADRD